MRRCPTCDTEFEESHPGCPSCAADEEVFRCARCAERFRGSDACPACGHLREAAACQLHPDREAIGRCVICGEAVCDECSSGESRAHLCEAHRTVVVIGGWAQVYSTASEFEASLVRENLEAEGIDARIFSQRDRAFSVDLGELSIVRLLVPAFAYEQALQLIRGHMDTEGEVAFACGSCGEAYDPGAVECASCGAAFSTLPPQR